VIDEVQKIPKILDVVHLLIEKHKKIQFIMTGSSVRKLKRGAANLLAGRAFSYALHPFCFNEWQSLTKNLNDVLQYGALPKVFELKDENEKKKFLRSYVLTYLKEEIQAEQIVRDMSSFRQFLDFAGQFNGQIISYSKIARRSGVDEKTVARFFEVLQDTLVGRFLEPYDESVRDRQTKKPKFYIFDQGVQRALTQSLELPLSAATVEYGQLFEQFIVNECFRLNDYYEKDFQFFYLRSQNDVEIDLVIRKPGRKLILVEIKSSDHIVSDDYKSLSHLGKNLKHERKIVICREKDPRRVDDIEILPWNKALEEIFK
jgi:predicted AAA+ superfamily ATPase